MTKYKVLLVYSNGEEDLDDDVFDSREEAEEHGEYLLGCCRVGRETLNLSDPYEWAMDEFADVDYEIVEVEE